MKLQEVNSWQSSEGHYLPVDDEENHTGSMLVAPWALIRAVRRPYQPIPKVFA